MTTLLDGLTPQAVARRLAGDGLLLRLGPFVVCLHSVLPDWIESLRRLYARFPVLEQPCVAHYHIGLAARPRWRGASARQIDIQLDGASPFLPGPRGQATAMLESMINFCVVTTGQQHFVLHSAVVERDGLAVLLPAPSGSGKSTLCAALVAHGWRLLSDEYAIFAGPTPTTVTPLPRPISLKNDSIELTRRMFPDGVFSDLVPGTLKGTVAYLRAPDEAVRRMDETATARLIVLPHFTAGAPLELVRLDKPAGFVQLMGASVNYQALGRVGFDAMTALVEACEIVAIRYGETAGALHAIEALHRDLAA